MRKKMISSVAKIWPLLFLCGWIEGAFAFNINTDLVATVKQNPFYLGLKGGYGSTNWSGLVDVHAVEDFSDVSVPVKAEDGGFAWGAFGGYEFSPLFAVEANYTDYPTAEIKFDEYNQYFPEAEDMPSHTQSYGLVAKLMVPVFGSGVRAYADIGPAFTHRSDVLQNTTHGAITFGAGFNYNIIPHLMAQLGFDYTSGFGRSDTTPVKDYIPFLYSVTIGLAARF